MQLNELVTWLNTKLEVDRFDDAALNGLQVEASEKVEKLAVAVDACIESVEQASAASADLLLVHHGIFWGKVRPIRRSLAKMLGAMFEQNLSLYASHLPLDAHPELGNSASIARLLELSSLEPFGAYRGQKIGHLGSLPKEADVSDLLAALGHKLDGVMGSALHGPKSVRRVAVVSGGAGSIVADAVEAGVDLMITGEPDHTAAVFAKDNGLNLAFFGHFATETLGVKALAAAIEEKFDIPWQFVGSSTGF